MNLTDLFRDQRILKLTLTGLSPQPRIETTAGDLEDQAHLAYSEGPPMLLNEPELHFWSSAK